MKLNPPSSPAARQISSRSDFIHDSGFIPQKADLVEKSTYLSVDKYVLFSGGDSWGITNTIYSALFVAVNTICCVNKGDEIIW